jgi:hypothetical protein
MDNFDLKKYLAEGRLFEDSKSNQLLRVLQSNQSEVEQQLGVQLANWNIDSNDDASVTDVDEFTGFSFKLADEVPMDFKGGGFGDDDTDPEIINVAGNEIAVIKYNL